MKQGLLLLLMISSQPAFSAELIRYNHEYYYNPRQLTTFETQQICQEAKEQTNSERKRYYDISTHTKADDGRPIIPERD